MRSPLTTARLDLRPFTLADVDAMHAVYGDPEVMRHVGEPLAAAPADTERIVRRSIAEHEAHGLGAWAVVVRASGAVIGDAGLRPLEGRGPEIELGYTLGRAWWGRGYATEAAGAWLDAALGPLGIQEVVAVVEPGNAASARVLEKVGMRAAGTRHAYGREHGLYRVRADQRRGA